ncbi:MAG: VOC family protein [Chloroflexota bacterium]|nr:VOC family protein [Chloroflexota bacterium]
MSLTLDHIIITVADLDAAIRDYQALGFTVVRGGVHANRATENALIVFEDGTYLELLAKTGEAPLPEMVDFSAVFANGMGLAGYALRTDDLTAEKARLEAAHIVVGDILPGERLRGDGRVVQWKLAQINDSFAPFLIEDVTPRDWRISTDPAITTHENRAVGIKRVEICVGDKWRDHQTMVSTIEDPRHINFLDPVITYFFQSLDYDFERIPKHLAPFQGKITPSQLETIDLEQEPYFTAVYISNLRQDLPRFARWVEENKVVIDLLKHISAALFAVHLLREGEEDPNFTLDRTHGVRFRQIIGIPAERGRELLPYLNQVDWQSMRGTLDYKELPDLLRMFTSDISAVRDYAFRRLTDVLFPEGMLFDDEVVEIIPTLFYLMSVPTVHDKYRLVSILSRFTKLMSAGSLWKKIAEQYLVDELPELLRQMDDPDAEVRIETAELLAFYPKFAEKISIIEPVLVQHIASDVSEEVRTVSVSTLNTLYTDGKLNRLSPGQIEYFSSVFGDEAQSFDTRLSAAIALSRHDRAAWADTVMHYVDRCLDNDLVRRKMPMPDYGKGAIDITGTVVSEFLQHLPERALLWLIAHGKHSLTKIRRSIASHIFHWNNGLPDSMRVPITSLMREYLNDPSPDARLSAVAFFQHQSEVSDDVWTVLQDMSSNDPSLNIRITASEVLALRPPESKSSDADAP